MLTLHHGRASMLCQRREFLRVGGGLAALGLTMPQALWQDSAAAGEKIARGQARSCILVYLLGGPPHLDTFDLKPDAPAEIRGPFEPIPTKVPGTQICELLPNLASIADKYALVRSVSHKNSNHTPMIYYTLTGRHTQFPAQDNDIRPPQREDFPHTGCVVSKFKPAPPELPGFVAIPEVAIRSSISGEYKRARTALRGGGAGFLGPTHEALAVSGEPGTAEAVPALALPPDVSAERFERRAELLALLDRGVNAAGSSRSFSGVRDQAVLLTGATSKNNLPAFSLDSENEKLRERYGRHRFGQSLLLARRLAEAGVPMVAIHFNEMTVCDGWDTHSKNFEACQSELLPMLDQSLSALLEDLDQRGILDETLVVCLGEFGRTPKINANAGRDHWGDCSSALLAGGGIRGGRVLGASDRIGAFPTDSPVDPTDIQATIYHCLGLPAHLKIYDDLARPFEISTGNVLARLF
ncbi:MAG TPA: DUF1501 domain-containing protein [Pirellulaceae bacterium]|nr:DUF1501 domain-containing protein [Pirellulaceae bacterium]